MKLDEINSKISYCKKQIEFLKKSNGLKEWASGTNMQFKLFLT